MTSPAVAPAPVMAGPGLAPRPELRLLRAGLVAVVAGAVMIAALHLVGPGRGISPVRRTISEFQLTDVRWVFDAAVLLVAAGGAVVLSLAARVLGGRRLGTGLLSLLAVAGLVGVVAFTKQDWSQPPTVAGALHRVASLVAFTGLPVTVLVLCARSWRRGAVARGWAIAAMAFAVAGLAHFLPIVISMALRGTIGGWWMGVPLGIVERGMAACEIAALVCLALWSSVRLAALRTPLS